jgi:anti-sigma factor RsiW
MKITRDVVNDLLPAYLSGEASADTRALVEELSAADPEIARLVESACHERSDPMLQNPVSLPPNLERETVARTRAELRQVSWRLGFTIVFTLLPFAFAFHGGRVTFLMVRDEPWSAISWVVAGFLLLEYELRTRRLGLKANRGRPPRRAQDE